MNFGPNKTEAICAWRGPGRREAAFVALCENEGRIQLGDGRTLRITKAYKHLGSYAQADCGMGAE
eukprot:8757622-Lingulodinium_polyedra.AAC.1